MHSLELSKLGKWCREENLHGNRSKASRIFKVLLSHYIKKYPNETSNSCIDNYSLKG